MCSVILKFISRTRVCDAWSLRMMSVINAMSGFIGIILDILNLKCCDITYLKI